MYRPQSGYYKDIVQQAVAYWESLVINHPFIDGNKRIGLASTDVFLRINGIIMKATPERLYDWKMKRIKSNSFDFESIESFLRRHI